MASGFGGVNFRGGNLTKPFVSSRRRKLRQTMSLRMPFDCRQFQALHTSCEMKRLLLLGYAVMISLIVEISWLVTDRPRYVRIVSIFDTVTYLALERMDFFATVDVLGHTKALVGYCKP